MKKFKTMNPKRGGWTEWVFPKNPYLFKCCDCDLVHEMQFKAFVEKNKKRGAFEIEILPEPIRAMFRARRWKKAPNINN